MARFSTSRLLLRALARLRSRWTGRGWDRTWRSAEESRLCWMLDEERPPLRSAVADGWLEPPGLLLELGCGLGHDAAMLAGVGFDVVAVDLSSVAIAMAERRYGESPRLRFVRGDVCTHLDIAGRFDFVVDLGCLHGIGAIGRPGYRTNVLARTAPGSRMLLLMNAVGSTPERRLTEVEALLSPPFSVVSWAVVEHQRQGADRTVAGPVFRLLRR